MSAAHCSLSPNGVGGEGWDEGALRPFARKAKAPLTPTLSPGAAGGEGDKSEIHA